MSFGHYCSLSNNNKPGRGRLTDPYQVGNDPLNGNSHKIVIRHTDFTEISIVSRHIL